MPWAACSRRRRATGDGEFPYEARYQGVPIRIRVNDFPAEPLYTLFVDGRAVLDLEDWPAAWVRPGPTPEVLRVAGAERARRGRIDAIVIADWAHRLCVAPPGPAEQVLAELGLSGDLVEDLGHRLLRPSPAGVERLEVNERDDVVGAIRVTPAQGGPGRSELNALLGAGNDVVRVHWDSAYPVHYSVTVGGGRYVCDVFAYFAVRPVDHEPSKSILLQRYVAT